MELQLGLALPSNTVFGLDLNSYVYKPKEVSGSGQVNYCLQLGPLACFSKASSSTSDDFSSSSSNNNNNNKNRKRSLSDAFNEITRDDLPQTLPLLLWNNQPNDHEDDDDDDVNKHNCSLASNNRIEEEDSDCGIVGWPPIKYRRKKIRGIRAVDNGCADCHGRPSSYVKVKMDGVAIARKIDPSLYTSFQDLKDTLLLMFGTCQENSTTYRLAYQDREGDWLLADDVSWRSFIGSVQRLKLMKNNNSGLFN
eukprot:XP_015579675.1 auxin-responsive protein IAA29 isoform X1 [Ricinus communis]